jgi:adenosylmethionine-8-amino-7-oxononanoate aminotransferase
MFGQRPAGWDFPSRQIGTVAELEALSAAEAGKVAAVVIEPLVQGAAGMKIWPTGTLKAVRGWCDRAGTLLIADEVLTGFGRTGRMFACEHEGVIPDLMILGKGLTGGYLPLAVTLLTEAIFKPFSEASSAETTLFYGHSYTGNALGCAAAKASLEIFEREDVLVGLTGKIQLLSEGLVEFRSLPAVREVRQIGFIAAIELSGPERHVSQAVVVGAAAVCLAARRYGLLTRPIRNVIVLMPPYCITEAQLKQAVKAIRRAIAETCGAG